MWLKLHTFKETADFSQHCYCVSFLQLNPTFLQSTTTASISIKAIKKGRKRTQINPGFNFKTTGNQKKKIKAGIVSWTPSLSSNIASHACCYLSTAEPAHTVQWTQGKTLGGTQQENTMHGYARRRQAQRLDDLINWINLLLICHCLKATNAAMTGEEIRSLRCRWILSRM